MPNWRQLSRKGGGTIWVNLDRCTVICEAPEHGATLLQFVAEIGGDEMVAESVDEVARLALAGPGT